MNQATPTELFFSQAVDQAVKNKLYAAKIPVVKIKTNIATIQDPENMTNYTMRIICSGVYFSEAISYTEKTIELIVPDNWWNQLKYSLVGDLLPVKYQVHTKTYGINLFRIPKEILAVSEEKLNNKNHILLVTPSVVGEFGVDYKERVANGIQNTVSYDISIPFQYRSKESVSNYLSSVFGPIMDKIIDGFKNFFDGDKDYALSHSIEVPANWYQALKHKMFPKKSIKTKIVSKSEILNVKGILMEKMNPKEFYHLKITEL